MSSHQEHFGRKFYQDKKTGYWISCDYSKNLPRCRAHQWVWFNHYGKPPKSYHLHHINDDKSDNRIDNLELMKGSRHLSIHMIKQMLDPIRKQKARENCDKIRPLTKAWHASEEGRAWHKFHAIKINFGNGELHKYECQHCLEKYQSKLIAEGRTRFCSNACKSAWRRKNKLDNIEKTCLECKVIFMSNKYSKSKTCSLSCGAKQRWKSNV